MDCSTPGFPVLHHLPEFTQIHIHWVGDAIQPSYPLLPPSPPAFNLSQQRIFFNELALASGGQRIGASTSASVLPMKTQSWFSLGLTGLTSLQSKWLKSLLQHHILKASIAWCSAFFMVQLSHPYTTTGKTIALTRWTFVGKVMSLSRFVIAFLPRIKRLLISWLQSPSAVILEPPKNKVSHCFHCFPVYLPWNDGTRCHDLRCLNVEF